MKRTLGSEEPGRDPGGRAASLKALFGGLGWDCSSGQPPSGLWRPWFGGVI